MKEFELIASIRIAAEALPKNGFEGIGDDCATLPLGSEALVFTTDALCEGVHFLRHATTPRELGHKTLAVNLSDVAAMGIRPVAVLLTLSLPTDLPTDWATDFMEGFMTLAKEHHVALIGGDTTRSEGAISLNVVAIGRGPIAHLKHRRDAQIGDTILVSDRLGGSAVGLRDLLDGRLDTPQADLHRNPQPEIEVGAWLGCRKEVHAMMDLSDGLASDLPHIMEEASVGCEIELTALPLAERATRNEAVSGGEDYKLLFTADSNGVEGLCRDFEQQFHRPLYPIGRITPSGLRWLDEQQPIHPEWKPFAHF